jgi:hypothetical protein
MDKWTEYNISRLRYYRKPTKHNEQLMDQRLMEYIRETYKEFLQV